LFVTSVPDAKQNLGEYLIEVKARAANFFDTLQIRGKYQWVNTTILTAPIHSSVTRIPNNSTLQQPRLPWIGGSEFSGIIIATPSPSSKFKKGDKIFGSSQGAFGDLISVKEENLQPIPEGWSFRDAAALYLLTGPTSYAALVLRANIQPGDWALIHGAAGGVGLGAVQVAKAFGAKAIATATSERNIAVLKSFGADYIIDYMNYPQWEVEVMRITGEHGVDVVFDPVGTISQSMKCAAFGSRLVPFGFVGGQIEAVKVNRILLKNVSVAGLHWGLYATEQPETVAKVWEGLFELIRKRMFRASVYESEHGKRYKLEDVPRAIKLLEEKVSWGEVVIELDYNQATL
jgi:NADPH2:quinone reductase